MKLDWIGLNWIWFSNGSIFLKENSIYSRWTFRIELWTTWKDLKILGNLRIEEQFSFPSIICEFRGFDSNFSPYFLYWNIVIKEENESIEKVKKSTKNCGFFSQKEIIKKGENWKFQLNPIEKVRKKIEKLKKMK